MGNSHWLLYKRNKSIAWIRLCLLGIVQLRGNNLMISKKFRSMQLPLYWTTGPLSLIKSGAHYYRLSHFLLEEKQLLLIFHCGHLSTQDIPTCLWKRRLSGIHVVVASSLKNKFPGAKGFQPHHLYHLLVTWTFILQTKTRPNDFSWPF